MVDSKNVVIEISSDDDVQEESKRISNKKRIRRSRRSNTQSNGLTSAIETDEESHQPTKKKRIIRNKKVDKDRNEKANRTSSSEEDDFLDMESDESRPSFEPSEETIIAVSDQDDGDSDAIPTVGEENRNRRAKHRIRKLSNITGYNGESSNQKKSRQEGLLNIVPKNALHLVKPSSTFQDSRPSSHKAGAVPPKAEQRHDLWTDRHKPHKAADLSIPAKKVNDVRQWLVEALTLGTVNMMAEKSQSNKLLILRGPPGVGKSTMMDVLAEELGFKIISWTGSVPNFPTDVSSFFSPASDTLVPPLSSMSLETTPVSQAPMMYTSQADDFGHFLRGAAYQPLQLVPTSSNSHHHKAEKKMIRQTQEQEHPRQVFVLEELPYHENEKSARQLQTAILHFLAQQQYGSSRHPLVLLYTEENEDTSWKSAELEKLLGRSILSSALVREIHINPVTDANMRKVLTRVCNAEGVRSSPELVEEINSIVTCSRGDVRHALLSLQLRYAGGRCTADDKASSLLQRTPHHQKVKKKGEKAQAPAVTTTRGGGGGGDREEKDRYLSNFHAIGKIIYPKRKPLKAVLAGIDEKGNMLHISQEEVTAAGVEGGRGVLAFAPEEALSQCEMEVDALSLFIQTHCIEHYGSMEDLSEALEYFSDSDLFMARLYSTTFHRDQTDPIFPQEYVLSLIGRTVAETNRTPQPSSGRCHLYTAPRFYDCLKVRREAGPRLNALCNDYKQQQQQQQYEEEEKETGVVVLPVRLTSSEMVTELIPYAKLIGGEGLSLSTITTAAGGGEQISSQLLPGETEEGGGGRRSAVEVAESLFSARSFLRLFNRRCAPAATSSPKDDDVTQQPSDLDVDDIVDDD